MLKRLVILVLFCALALWLLAHAGSFLVVNNPKKSDLILVLANAGEPDRYLHAVDLVKQGYALRIVFDVQGNSHVYGASEEELARQFVDQVLPTQTTICPTTGDSTYEELIDSKRCIDQFHASSVLIVTSDYHTRRAFAIFRKRLPGHVASIAATTDSRWFATDWWKRRRWAKTTLEEWQKLIWWAMVDRWHRDIALE